MLPDATLIATEAPAEDSKCFKAFTEVRAELLGMNLQTVPANDEIAIRQFAIAQ